MTTGTPLASRVIHCCHCRGALRVSARALSVPCPHCHRRVGIEDIVIAGSFTGRTMVTCGDVLIEVGGQIHIPISAQNVLVRGLVKGTILAMDSVTVTHTGRVFGDVETRRLHVEEGGRITGACRMLVTNTPGDPEHGATSPAGATVPALPSTLPQQNTPSTAPKLRPIPLNPLPRRRPT
ncbi:MAG: polymer-forming cytoskeletal protein [Phycisphaerae bacterium]